MNLEKYLAIPYKLNGRSFEGTDCYGLVTLWFRNELGIELIDPIRDLAAFNDLKDRDTFISRIGTDWATVKYRDIKPNDGVLICNNSTTPNHAGIVLTQNTFLQMLEGPGCHVAKIDRWLPRIYRFYRHKGTAK